MSFGSLRRVLFIGSIVLLAMSFPAACLANLPPTPVVYSPLAESIDRDDNTLFDFGINDPEGLALGSYQIQVSTDPQFSSILIDSSRDLNHYVRNELPAGHRGYMSAVRLADRAPGDSPYYWRLKVRDQDPSGGTGLWSDWTAPIPFYVDNATPEVYITSPSTSESLVNTVGYTFRWTYWDPKNQPQQKADVYLLRGSTPIVSDTINSDVTVWTNVSIIPISDSRLALSVRVMNAAGIPSKPSIYRCIAMFNQLQVRAVPASPISGATGSDPVSHFAWTYESASSTPQTEFHLQVSSVPDFSTTLYDIDSPSSNAFCDLPQPITAAGQYYWRVAVNNGTVNGTYWSATQTFTIGSLDGTAPVTTTDYGQDGQWVKGPVTVHLSATDSESGVQSTYYGIDEGPPVAGVEFLLQDDGLHNVEYWSVDNAGNQETAKTITVKIDNSGPVLTAMINPAPNSYGWNNSTVTVQFTATDAGSGVATVTDPIDVGSETSSQTITGTATDALGNTSETSAVVKIDKAAPVINNLLPRMGAYVSSARPTITGNASDSLSGVDPNSIMVRCDGSALPGASTVTSGGITFVPNLDLSPGQHTIVLSVSDKAGNPSAEIDTRFTVDTSMPPLPPDPASAATPLTTGATTDIAAATQFLYTGSTPVQTGVAPGTIQPVQAAVLRGRVLDREGYSLPGVTVSILGRPELGQTITRDDGAFDLAVNGGGTLVVRYQRAGHLSVQRQVSIPWQDYTWLPDVVMIRQDSQVSTIDLASPTQVQIARGTPVSDASGSRQSTILFPPGVQVNGLSSSTLNVRATEYTVGDAGRQSMPAALPPTTGYTYAVELTVDEAEAQGLPDVTFSQPVYYYVENFIGFPVGTTVPVGYYDKTKAVWVPSDNGRVIQVLSITGGMADLDLDGSGLAADAMSLASLGITDGEREKLAGLYTPGQSLWRVALGHFSIWDLNWAFGPPGGSMPPTMRPSGGGDPKTPKPCVADGSIIEVQNQILREQVPLTGTPYTLNYSSDRTPGRLAAYRFPVPLSGDTLPPGVKRIELEVRVAGRLFTQTFPAAPNQSYTFVWDGKDAYGRTLQGGQKVEARVGYVYDGSYQKTDRFGYNGNGILITGVLGDPTRKEVTLWQIHRGNIGTWDARAYGIGGWTLDVHHSYGPGDRILYLGDGTKRDAEDLNEVITTIAGTGASAFNLDSGLATQVNIRPSSTAVGPDGSVYVADGWNDRIRKIQTDGTIITVAGKGTGGFAGDGGPATQALLEGPNGIALGPDGSIYVADSGNNRIRRISPDGIITTIAGTGVRGHSGDGGPAILAQLNDPLSIAVGADSSIYFACDTDYRVRRIGPDGIISTIAGTGVSGFSGDGGPATQAQLYWPYGVAVGADGSVYIADRMNNRVRRVGTDGIITTVAGSGNPLFGGFAGDGGPATQAKLYAPTGIALGPDGSLFIADEFNNRIRRVGPDGIITSVAGSSGAVGFSGDRGPATAAKLAKPYAVTVAQDGSLYISDKENNRIRLVASTLPSFDANDLAIASEDGGELYRFDPNGRHLTTVNTLTGATRYTFGYDQSGRLAQVTDGDGNITVIERDANGAPTAIVAPFGQRTVLGLDDDRYLETIANPKSEQIRLTYKDIGLLETFTDPKNQLHRITYDELGRLYKDEDPAGGCTTLERTELSDGWQVTKRDKAKEDVDYVTVYKTQKSLTGEVTSEVSGSCCNKTTSVTGTDGSTTTTQADGTVVKTVIGPDPRFGMQAPIVTSQTVTTPVANKTRTITANRVVVLANLADPLSLQRLTDTVTLNGKPFVSVYEAATRQITSTSPEGRQTQTTLDAQGRVVTSQVSGLETVTRQYDTRGRLQTISLGTGGLARVTTFTYNPTTGLLESVTDPLLRTMLVDFDGAGRLQTQTLPGGRQVSIGHDANGNINSITPPGKTSHGFTHTEADVEETYTPPPVGTGNSQVVKGYNLDKQLTSVTRLDGSIVTLDYDNMGRLFSLTTPEGATSYTYEPTSGNLDVVVTPALNSLHNEYDGSLLSKITWDTTNHLIAGNVSYTYNNDLTVETQSVNGANPVTFLYDDDGLLTDAGAMTLTPEPQKGGLLKAATLGKVADSRTYNGFGELTEYRASYDGSDIFAVGYTPDSLGRIHEKTETVGGETHTYTYEYNAAGRLADVYQDSVQVSHYEYDLNGNRIAYVGSDGTISGTPDAQDRLVQYGDTSYEYTANGELKKKITLQGTTTYSYDVLGNLRAVTLPDATSIEYMVDGQNRRIGKKVNGSLVQAFLYQDGLAPAAELDSSGNVVSRFVYATGVNVPDYMVKNGVTYRIITDHLGSPRMVIDSESGVVVQRMDYDEFGNVILDTSPGFQPFGFAGGLYDSSTRLVRFGARDFEPETGRWTAKDPLGFGGGDPNLYGYVANNPLNGIDPTGENSLAIGWGLALSEPTPIGEAIMTGVTIGVGVVDLIHLIQDSTKKSCARTPAKGKPGTAQEFPDGKGGKTKRTYGKDGRATKDIDSGHDHGAGDPHSHDWDWSKNPPRQPGRPLLPGEEP